VREFPAGFYQEVCICVMSKIIVSIHCVFISQYDLALINYDSAEGVITLFPGTDCKVKSFVVANRIL